MHTEEYSQLSARCLSLLAAVALWDREKLVSVAYALKNDSRLTAVRVARRWVALPPADLREVALRVLEGSFDEGTGR